MSSNSDTYCKRIVESIIAAVEAGHPLPWRKTWEGGTAQWPCNISTGRNYTGINIWILLTAAAVAGYSTNYWVGYSQAQKLGGGVKRGESPTWIVRWKPIYRHWTETVNGEEQKHSQLVSMTMLVLKVWNLDQCYGIEAPKAVEGGDHTPLELCEEMIQGYENGPTVTVGPHPCYRPRLDQVACPAISSFESAEAYYSTMFHELVHSTGHESRLARREVTCSSLFGDHDYSVEELVAEFGAAMLSGKAGIVDTTLDNSTAYIAHWVSKLRDEPRMLVNAAQRAQRAVEHVLGISRQYEQPSA